MFIKTVNKLNDARSALENLKQASDFQKFRASFNSFLSHSRAVTYVLQKEGKRINGFSSWYDKKQKEMRSDELLRFVHNARTDDFHKGKPQLRSSTYIKSFSTNQAKKPSDPKASMIIGSEGVFWVVNKGTPKERRVPIKEGKKYTSVVIDKVPQKHLGKRIAKKDPIYLSQLVLNYLENLVHEAKTTFN